MAKLEVVFIQNSASLCEKMVITLIFQKKKKQTIFRRILAKIVKNRDHKIDPWFPAAKVLSLSSLFLYFIALRNA
jgi:hypothetical protein